MSSTGTENKNNEIEEEILKEKEKEILKEKEKEKEKEKDNKKIKKIIKKKETEKEDSNEIEYEDENDEDDEDDDIDDDDDDDDEKEEKDKDNLDEKLRDLLKDRMKRSNELKEIVSVFLNIYGNPLEIDTFEEAMNDIEEWNNILKELIYANKQDIICYENNASIKDGKKVSLDKKPIKITWRNSDLIFFKNALKKLIKFSKNKNSNLPLTQQQPSPQRPQVPHLPPPQYYYSNNPYSAPPPYVINPLSYFKYVY